jgi:glycine/D-amino acid oxidase-like deaminating enzyme
VWVAESAAREPAPAAPPLRGSAVADVVIVGGGFTGVSTAWHLRSRRPEAGIALLEAGVLGQGASGRNGGQVLHWINGVAPDSPEAARRIHAATGAGIDLAEEWSRRYAPESFRRQGCLEIYTSARRAEAAAGHAQELAAAGIPVEFLPASALRVQGACGALLDPLAGRLDGYALLQAMRSVLLEQGIALHEHTRVLRVRAGGEVVCETPQGELRARALVLATNAYTPALGFFRRGILPLHSHVLATEPLAESRWQEIGWGDWDGFTDDLDRIAYACRTPGGRLLLGGGGNPAYRYRFGGSPFEPAQTAAAGGDPRATRFMQGVLARYFPGVAGAAIAHRWSGPLAITLDRVCSMGVGGEHGNVYHALGYSGHGVALGLLAGRVLADLYAGNHDDWRDLPFYQKRLYPEVKAMRSSGLGMAVALGVLALAAASGAQGGGSSVGGAPAPGGRPATSSSAQATEAAVRVGLLGVARQRAARRGRASPRPADRQRAAGGAGARRRGRAPRVGVRADVGEAGPGREPGGGALAHRHAEAQARLAGPARAGGAVRSDC